MRFLVLGGGLQGSACAFDLLGQDDVESVIIADLRPERPRAVSSDERRLDLLEVDFADEAQVRRAMEGRDVVLSAAPYAFNNDLARLAIESGCNYSDLGGNTEIVFQQLAMSDRAVEAGCTVIPDMGVAPGLTNVLAAEATRRLDSTAELRMYVGGLPENPRPPLNYQIVFSLEGAIDYLTTPSWILSEGRLKQQEPLSDLELLKFEGLGTLEAFHTAGGASTLPWRFENRVDYLAYKTLRYPGHAQIMGAIRDLGLLSDDPVTVAQQEIVPRDVFIAAATPQLIRPGEPDLVVLRVVAKGESAGETKVLTWNLVDREDPETGITAMMRCTGFTLSIVGLLIGRGVIDETGVLAPDEGIPYESVVEELDKRGVRIAFEETAG
jgi:lysine 6-dehydrogenase